MREKEKMKENEKMKEKEKIIARHEEERRKRVMIVMS